jgi:tRNA threonylcarbamoyl adenosine modification protein YjeE
MPRLTEGELREWGHALGARLAPGSIVTLDGPLGAGKTTLVQAIVRGLGVVAGATSPTYTYVHRYEGRRGPVYHLDCYRLKHPDDAADLDWEAITQADAALIEWPEKAGDWVPRPTLRITLGHTDDPDLRSLETA